MTIERGRISVRSRQSARGLRMSLLGLVFLAAVSAAASAQTYIEFNAPSGGTAFPLSINTDEVITGYYLDASGFNHGFVGTAGGTLTGFDVSGSFGTTARSINSAGVIAGIWSDENAGIHGYVRTADGAITSFDAPNASKLGYGKGTFAESINTSGVIAGYCNCTGEHGLVRSADGAFTEFAVPGASGTLAHGINTEGAITGSYFVNGSVQPVYHGYVRSTSGTITTFDAPGAGTSQNNVYVQGTFALSINDNGVIVGYYVDSSDGFHGFVRSASGTITTLDAPGAGTGRSPLTATSLELKPSALTTTG